MAGRTFQELWDIVEPVVQNEGLELYDIERGAASSSRGRGVIRVFLLKREETTRQEEAGLEKPAPEGVPGPEGVQGGVTVGECALISRRLSAIDRFEEFIGERSVLEVSSPGINRKLRTMKHFEGAIGNRIVVKAYFDNEGKELKVKGDIIFCDDNGIVLKDEKDGVEKKIVISDISSARIDFDFSKTGSTKTGSMKKGKKVKKPHKKGKKS